MSGGVNRNKKKDNIEDIIVSLKTVEQADKRELFQNRITGELNYKKFDGSIISLETLELPYKRYIASLRQTGTDAPVATVLLNELGGDLVWGFGLLPQPGQYRATLAGAFANKLVRIIPPMDSYGAYSLITSVYAGGKYDDDSIYLVTGKQFTTLDTSGASVVSIEPADEQLFDGYSFIEIQVWDMPE